MADATLGSLGGVSWLTEPERDDPTWATEGESNTAWLARSTLPAAAAARAFLRFNISQVPGRWHGKLCHDLEERWEKSFFELVVARSLQALGADIEVETGTDSGRAPDFRARFNDGEVVVEATAPEFRPEEQSQRRDMARARMVIEAHAPPGWSIWIHSVPGLGPADSHKPLKRALQELARWLSPTNQTEAVLFETKTTAGPVRLTLIPTTIAHTAVVNGPAIASWDNPVDRIRRAVKKKRDQVRGAQVPVLLAINGGTSDDRDLHDRALFGSRSFALDHDMKPICTGFAANAEFASPGVTGRAPTFAGVIAFGEVGFMCPSEPVLYIHPRFAGTLPAALGVLEQRRLHNRSQIQVTVPSVRRVLEALGPIR